MTTVSVTVQAVSPVAVTWAGTPPVAVTAVGGGSGGPNYVPSPSGLPDGQMLITQGGAYVAADLPDSELIATAGSPISGHRVIAINDDGEAVYANCTDASALAVVGFSSNAANTGGQVILVPSGYLEWPAGNLTVGSPLFLSTAGAVSMTPPSSGWLRQVAVAVAAGAIVVSISPAYSLGST